ncbi:MAG: four-carbon acid sugar kinase family protein [Bacteroidetes bacterium]|jgi:uncharacterized protein YgbK (DUF1537 family)|nr:four-carbon acid sugar kinase family protein [Bacteroidota bacterium]
MKNLKEILIAFYGDDFTGSTDAMEFLSRAGAKTMLFLEPPSAEKLRRYQPLDAFGVAGMTRSMKPIDMVQTLKPVFEVLNTIDPRHLHYKVCSTFDSSPEIGSIGKVIDLGAKVFNSAFVPLLVAAPNLSRYCAFGNLFAGMGIVGKNDIYRLDRHPSMSKHPITPADESDLRIHLSRQTQKKIGLFNILDVEKSFDESVDLLNTIISTGNEIVLFDAIYEHQMKHIGKLLDYSADVIQRPLFSVGSSGIEKALGDHWKEIGQLTNRAEWHSLGKKEPLLVASGSCSPVTAAQIEWALSQGFREVPVDPEILTEDEEANTLVNQYFQKVISFLRKGESVVLHTCIGPEDSHIDKTNIIKDKKDWTGGAGKSNIARIYGQTLGKIVQAVLDEINVERIVVAGGDTSGHVARALGIETLEMIAPIVTGAPMCKVHAPSSSADGVELNLKGGQVGNERVFEKILEGKAINKS